VRKLRITTIGTCRVTTPLRRALGKFPIESEHGRVYGYVHSSAEAVQQIQFLQREQDLPDEILPITFRPDIPRDYRTENWTAPDLNIVEISSAKLVSSHGRPVQRNYVYRYFADFFADPARTTQFWSLVKRKDRRALLEYLRGESTYRRLPAEDRALLMSLTMEEQTFDQLKGDMEEIAERLGRDKLLFVTHVNVTTPDEAVIPARDRLIRWVKLAAEQMGIPCFDPTEAMREFGQERAMEHGGLDLTHYTPAFYDRVFAIIHRDHVAKLVEAGPYLSASDDEESRQQIIADNIEAMIELDFRNGAREMFEALRQHPNNTPLKQLRGMVLSRIGDFEGAIAAFTSVDGSATLSQDARMAFLDALVNTGDWQRALGVAEDLLADEYADTAIYEGAALASERLGRDEDALGHWKQAFRHDRSNLRAALNALVLLARLGEPEHLDDWKREVIEHSEEGDGILEVAQWALANGEEDLVARCFRVVVNQSLERAEDILRSAVRNGLDEAVIECLKAAAELPDQMVVRRRFRTVSAEIIEHATRRIEQRDTKSAFRLANAVRPYASASAAVRIVRQVAAHFRDPIREAYAKEDFQAVVALAAEAGEIIFDSTRLAVLVGVSLSRLGHSEEAREIFRRLYETDPESPLVLRWSGRLAQADEDYATAIRMYGALARSQDPVAKRFQAETSRFLERAGRRALQIVRILGREEQFAEAIAIAEAVRDETDMAEQAELELARIHRMLRIQLRAVEQDEGDLEDREPILRLMDRIKPDDEAVLRRLALEFMRQFRFSEAADYWERLDAIKPNVESVVRNRHKCRLLAARRQRSSLTEAAA